MEIYKIYNKIYNENCIDTMKRIPDQFIDGIITSPPYNIATKRTDCYYDNGYSDIDNLSPEEYLKIRTEEFREFSRIIKNGAVICYNISYCKDNPILPTLLVSKIYNETDLTIADIICWKKNTSIPFQTSSTKLSRIAELIYIFVKKDYLHSFQTNKEISKTNEKTGQKFYRNYTNFIEAKNNDGYHCSLKASFSQELVDKIINIYFGCDSLIYDPFTGIGTTELSCIENSLNYIGSEISSEYFKIAEKRIKTSSDKKSQRLILQDLRLDEFF